MSIRKIRKEHGFLSSIGIKIKYPENNYEIEGFIKAPDNSPYKNGIFNFIIKYQDNYPKEPPRVIIKTRIFHCNVLESNGKCDIDHYLREYWKNDIDLPQILCIIYVFFVANNPDSPFDCNMADIYKKSYSEFEQKCQEWIDKYGSRNFNTNINYLFEGKYNQNNNNSDSSFYLLMNDHSYKIYKKYGIIPIRDILDDLHEGDRILIVGNKVLHVYYYDKDVLDINKYSNKTVFIIPNFRWFENIYIKS